jgi:alpha-amylase/alpha-mannosidase (GH57 family)
MTRVALLWHMHQPYYEDLVTREHILPWVRMHALKDYYGMVALLEEFPQIRVTFNLVPSLLVQLEAFAGGRAHDRYLELGLKAADTLGRDEVLFVLRHFFHAQRERMIDVYPRYSELLRLRGDRLATADLEAAARRFSAADLRDLQVWQKLAWVDPYYLDRDPRIRALVAKGHAFDEGDKATLRTVELEILNAVIPAYRARAAAGQIEISASPFYHPILPLLCDTDVYKRTHPHSAMPRQRFGHPEDAQEQLERAARYHEQLFGLRPAGLWPSEGSVSDAMVPLAAQAGFQWMATDELILARSSGITFHRDGFGHLLQPAALYQPYRVEANGAAIACGFRDHALSDLIGFTYAGWSAERAADDFVGRLVEGGRRAAASGVADPVIFVILDGENAWEHFDGGGRPFLRALYSRLSQHHELETVTMTAACRQPARTLQGVFPGSWIDANFYIWIGHRDDHRAWSQLADARQALESPHGIVAPATAERAYEERLSAEASDWFWWYGDDHSSEHDAEFDDLFRRHLRNVYRLLGDTVPDELFATNISTGAAGPVQLDPTGYVRPTIDGEDTSYFEWLGAGVIDVREVGGAMHQVDRRPSLVSGLLFGLDDRALYLRVEGRPLADAMDAGASVALTFLNPALTRCLVLGKHGATQVVLQQRQHGSEWSERPSGASAALGNLLEIRLPLTDLGGDQDQRLSFFLTVHDRFGAELERHPSSRPIEIAAHDPWFIATNWSA